MSSISLSVKTRKLNLQQVSHLLGDLKSTKPPWQPRGCRASSARMWHAEWRPRRLWLDSVPIKQDPGPPSNAPVGRGVGVRWGSPFLAPGTHIGVTTSLVARVCLQMTGLMGDARVHSPVRSSGRPTDPPFLGGRRSP